MKHLIYDARVFWLVIITPISFLLIIRLDQNEMVNPLLIFTTFLFGLQTIEYTISMFTKSVKGDKIKEIKTGKAEIDFSTPK